MKDNELIKKNYIGLIKQFEFDLKSIDDKYKTFAEIEIDSECIYEIGDLCPSHYFRNISLKKILLK